MRLGREAFELDLYETLGLTRGASPEEIRAAYRASARNSHPDLNPHDPRAGERMARVNLAGRVLLDPYLRAAYDRVAPRRAKDARAREGGRTETAREAARDGWDGWDGWYERWAAPPVAACDEWVAPAPEPRQRRPPKSKAMRRFLRDVRGVESRLSLRFGELVGSTPERVKLQVFAICVIAALLLIDFARPPRDALQPTTIAPAALHP